MYFRFSLIDFGFGSNQKASSRYWNAYGYGVSAASPLDFSDFRAFGGFSSAMAKEYSLQASVCSYTVNQVIFPANAAKKYSVIKNKTKANRITVGLLGL